MEENLNQQLYEKMSAEQDKFRDWLTSQLPEKILNHAYEYATREDILMAVEYMDLPADKAQALLSSPAPLDEIYNDFAQIEGDHMDIIRDCIETRADDILENMPREKVALQKETGLTESEGNVNSANHLPVYRETAEYAVNNGELDLYRLSMQANVDCRKAIEDAIADGYDGKRLYTSSVKDIIKQFGAERVEYVLANTVQQKDWDLRFSRDNKTWAKGISVCPKGCTRFTVDRSHPGLTDLFVSAARKELREIGKSEKIAEKPSIREQLKTIAKELEPKKPKEKAQDKGLDI